jgi:hypothetical protein
VVGGGHKGVKRYELFARERICACGVRTVSSTPLVVTHPCALVRDALHRILTKSQFRPVDILPTLDVAENYPHEAGLSIWLLGVSECSSTTNDLVRRVVGANPSVRGVTPRPARTIKTGPACRARWLSRALSFVERENTAAAVSTLRYRLMVRAARIPSRRAQIPR